MKKYLPSKNLFSVLILSALSGCDIVKDDVTPIASVNADLFAYAEQPTVLNVTALADGKDVEIGELDAPEFGSFNEMLIENRKYLVYSPSVNFKGKTEKLHLKLYDTNNKELVREVGLEIASLDGGRKADCSTGSPKVSGLYDYIKIKPGQRVELDLLDNDIFCGVGYNGGIVSGHDFQNDSGVESLISLGPTRKVTLTYTAPANFEGTIKILYEVGINWTRNPDPYGDSNEILANPNYYLEAFLAAILEIEVSND